MMGVSSLVFKHLILILGVLGILLFAFVNIVGIEYDSSGVLGYIYWSSYLFSIPFLISTEVMFTFINREYAVIINLLSLIVHLAFCYFSDVLILKIRRRLKSNKSN